MTFGYRVFIFTPEKVTRLSKKAFNDFFLMNRPALKAFANQTLNLAIVFYKLKNGKPAYITSIDTTRAVVDKDGMLDAEFADRCTRQTVHKLNPQPEPANDQIVGTSQKVIDAALRFDQRGWEVSTPKLPGAIHKQILEVLFR